MSITFTAPASDARVPRRPLVDVVVDHLEQPIRCLIDTGSPRT